MSNHTSKANGGPLRMLSVQEAAGELGISRSLIYELLSSGAVIELAGRYVCCLLLQ
jgi:predicted DNA-binding transcriptional regulator AlpA